jgi:hypothetical protein
LAPPLPAASSSSRFFSFFKRDTNNLPASIYPRSQYNDFAYSFSTEDIIKDKLTSIFDGDLIAINAMSSQKAQNVGFLLASIYDKLGWDYSPETTKENFHEFLGNKLLLTSTEMDSIYNAYLQTVSKDRLTALANQRRTAYLDTYNEKRENYNLQVFFDHYTEDFFDPNEKYYANNTDQTILFPQINRFKVKSPFLEIVISDHSFLYHLNIKEKRLQTSVDTNISFLLNNKKYTIKDLTLPSPLSPPKEGIYPPPPPAP